MLLGKNKTTSAPSGASENASIFDVSTAEFEQRVLLASMERPVIVDFWAPWCGPCKKLGPILEKAVQEAKGAVCMAKVNMDENQELAAALRIQSIPTVYAFFQGRPVDAFQGAIPESQIKAFVQKLTQIAKSSLPDALDIPKTLIAASTALSQKDFKTAQQLYAAILQQDEKNIQSFIGLVRTMIASGEIDPAKTMVENAPADIAAQPSFSEARAMIELAAGDNGDFAKLQATLDKNADDPQARYDLATAQFASGEREQAIDHLIEIMRKKPGWNEDAARKQLLKFFEAMGSADPLTLAGRRKLSSLLFS